MNLTVEHVGDILVVVVAEARLDANNVQAFRSYMSPALQQHHHVVLDVSQVHFVDSAGLGALLACMRQVHGAAGQLKLCGLTKPVEMLFTVMRMQHIFALYNTRDEALQAFQA